MNTARLACLALGGLLMAPTSCGDEEDDCAVQLDGTTWRSVEQFPGPEGGTYRHELSFEGGQFDWLPSDQTASGAYQCSGAEITVEGEAFVATYAEGRDELDLRWTGITDPVAYERAE